MVLPKVTQPIGIFGNNLKIWYYFVLGLVEGVAVGARGAGGGMTRPIPPGLIAVNGFAITGVVVWDIWKGIVMAFFSSFYVYLVFFFFFYLRSRERSDEDEPELEL